MGENQSAENVESGRGLMDGVWVVAMCEGSRGYIGRVSGHKKFDDDARNKVLSKPFIHFELAFDYFSQILRAPAIDQQGRPMLRNGQPVIATQREPLVSGMEFTLHKCPAYVRWTSVLFFDEMEKEDRKLYEEFVGAACEQNQKLRLEKIGVSLADRLEIPGNGRPPHVHMDLRDLRK